MDGGRLLNNFIELGPFQTFGIFLYAEKEYFGTIRWDCTNGHGFYVLELVDQRFTIIILIFLTLDEYTR